MYSVIDGFGNRMTFGTKASCEQYIQNSIYRPLFLVCRKLIQPISVKDDNLPDREDKTAVIDGETPKTITYVAKHAKGGMVPFKDIETVAVYFNVSEQALTNGLEDGEYKLRGRLKDWTIEKIEE